MFCEIFTWRAEKKRSGEGFADSQEMNVPQGKFTRKEGGKKRK